VFIFGSVLLKKSNQTDLKKKNRNRFKPTGFSYVRFGFLEQKPVQPVWLGFSDLARFGSVVFRFGSIFFRFGSIFSVWLGFFPVFSVQFGLVFSVQFGFKKPKPN